MNQRSPDWRQNYAKWVMGIGAKAMEGQGGGTGSSTVPSGMVAAQHMGQPKRLNGNALMQPQHVHQGMFPQQQQQQPVNPIHAAILQGMPR